MAFFRRRARRCRGARLRAAALVCLGIAAALVTVPAAASEHDRGRKGEGPGEVVPLQEVLERVHERFDGSVLKVELEREDDENGGPWVYEIKVLTPDGNILKLEYDARTAELLEVNGRRERDHDDD